MRVEHNSIDQLQKPLVSLFVEIKMIKKKRST